MLKKRPPSTHHPSSQRCCVTTQRLREQTQGVPRRRCEYGTGVLTVRRAIGGLLCEALPAGTRCGAERWATFRRPPPIPRRAGVAAPLRIGEGYWRGRESRPSLSARTLARFPGTGSDNSSHARGIGDSRTTQICLPRRGHSVSGKRVAESRVPPGTTAADSGVQTPARPRQRKTGCGRQMDATRREPPHPDVSRETSRTAVLSSVGYGVMGRGGIRRGGCLPCRAGAVRTPSASIGSPALVECRLVAHRAVERQAALSTSWAGMWVHHVRRGAGPGGDVAAVGCVRRGGGRGQPWRPQARWTGGLRSVCSTDKRRCVIVFHVKHRGVQYDGCLPALSVGVWQVVPEAVVAAWPWLRSAVASGRGPSTWCGGDNTAHSRNAVSRETSAAVHVRTMMRC